MAARPDSRAKPIPEHSCRAAPRGWHRLDRIDARGDRILDPLRCRRVRRYLAVGLMRLFYDDAHLLDGQCRVLPIRIDLDQIGSKADLLAHCPPGDFGAADHLGARWKIREIGGDAKGIILTD